MKGSIKYFLLIALTAIMAPNSISAQESSMTCTVSQNPATVGSRIKLTVTFTNCKPKDGHLGRIDIAGLQFAGGPSISQQSSSYNFQSTTSTLSYTYNYNVVSQKDVQIPGLKVATTAGAKKTEAFTLKVQPRGSNTGNAKQGYGQLATVIDVSKTKVHIGEPVVISYKIFTRLNGLRYRETIPDLEGFWKEEIAGEPNNQKRTVINGVEYIEITVKEVLAFPQQTGEFVIDGFDIQGVVQINFFNQREVQAQSRPVKITVSPLPSGKPENFIGTFGNLRLTSKVNTDSIGVNEAFNYELTYYGQGNMKLIREPEIVWPVEFEVFDPEIKDKIKVGKNGESGTRTYKFLVIPRAPGVYDLPQVKASYYDYGKDAYAVRNTAPASIKIFRDGSAEGASAIYSTKSDVQVLNHDIRHISTTHGHWKHGGGNWGLKLIWVMFLLGPVVALMAYAGKRKRDCEANDLVGTRNKKAKAQLSKALKASGKADVKEAAYAAIGEALEEYLCSKLGIGRSSFNRANAKQILTEQLGDAEGAAWDKLLQQCEMARYAPGAVSDPTKATEEIMKLANAHDSKMKIVSLIAVAILLSPMLSLAQTNPDSLFSQANDAYLSGDYTLAAELYEEISDSHKCFELEYNLGNAHYKLDNVGEAILHYERAKVIDPLNDDLRANMLLADLRAIDKIEPLPGAGLDKILEVVFAGKLFKMWFFLGLGLWTTGFALIAIRLKWRESLAAPFARGGAALLITLSLIFISFSVITHSRIIGTHRVVVMSERVDVKSNPTENSTDLFQLHEGARACVLSEEGGWTEIRLDNGNVGWILSSDVEFI